MAAPSPRLPYAHLHLRTNPFRTLDAEERATLAVVDVDRWVEQIRARRGRRTRPLAVQLLGPGGCGKTTHLEAIRRHFPGAPMLAWSAVEGWPVIPSGDPLFVDDAHELPRGGLRRVVAGRRALILATRVDLGPRLARQRLDVRTLQVAPLVTPRRVRRIVRRRLDWARRTPGPLPSVEDRLTERLLSRHGTDLRALLGELYRHIQEHPVPWP